MQIEHVARIRLAARRAAQQQRHLAIRHRLLRQIVVEDHRVAAVVAEELAHGAAGVRRQELHRRRIGRGGGDHDGIFHRAVFLQRVHELRDGGALLPDRDVDAVQLLRLVGAGVDGLLVDDRVDDHRGLAGLPIADDQLALAAADRDQRVDRLEAGLHRLVHRLARDDAGRLHLDAAALGGDERALAVDRIAEPVDHAAEQRVTHRHVHDRAGARDGVAFADRRSSPKITTPTLSVSRFSAMPRRPAPGNSTISPAMQFCRPNTRAMPSPTDSTWPVSATLASVSNAAICFFRISEISAGRISYQAAPFMAYCRRCRRDFREVS